MRALMDRITFQTIKSWIGARLLRLLRWLQLVVFRRALNLRVLCLRLLDSEIRLLDPSLLQIGEQDDEDYVVEYVARVLIGLPQLPESLSAVERLSEVASNLVDKSRASQEIKSIVGTYFRCSAFIATELKSPEDERQHLISASQFIAEPTPFGPKELLEIHKSYGRRFDDLRTELAERSALKFDIEWSDVIAVLTICPAIIFLAGFFYTSVLLGAFGLNASLSYSLGDYVASSLSQISAAAVSVALAVASFTWGLRHGSLRSRTVTKAIQAQDKTPLVFFSVTIGATVAVVVHALDGRFNQSGLLFLGVILSYALSENIARLFVRNRLPVSVALLAVFLFATYSSTSLFAEIHDLKTGEWGSRTNTSIFLKPESKLDVKNLVIIAANSGYIFAIDKTTKIAHVIARDQISELRVVKPN